MSSMLNEKVKNLYGDKIVGNCGCVKCGLRGHSKNVATRSVFSRFPDDLDILDMLESWVRIRSVDGVDYIAIKETWGQTEEEEEKLTDAARLAKFVKHVQKHYDPELRALEVLFCAHDWAQDEGTNTV